MNLKMTGVYFSGTGNTKHCVERLVKGLHENAPVYALENKDTINAIKNSETIIFGYPVQYSNLPKIVRDFIVDNANVFCGKKIFIAATMGLFSGDGAGLSARLFKKYGAKVLGGLHIKMPDCIGDVKALKRPLQVNKQIAVNADAKIDKAIAEIKNNRYPKEGLNFFYHLAGLFGQRLYFYNKTKTYYTKTKVDNTECVHCGLCASLCPMNNINLTDSGIDFNGKCTMCYRCFSHCPQKAITVIGKKVFEQSKYENYK
ncbi:MAG: EFR1 family ferrodoxin [Bacteroides sp.]|nr:EFR1 family ferrodoxin [Prevotella sp.]MCM1408138.1 EFR1 family ferrodoxin [Treponema brennaborense]MCM1469462.1 EFR1 family ferrodoxin [Bacteroides sp.]